MDYLKNVNMSEVEKFYLIGDFKFIPERQLLIKKDIERKLERMQCNILLTFIEQPKTIITRECLEQKVWNGRYVTEQAINNKISELRKLFEDDYRNPHYFKTHHQLGYELIADCVVISKEDHGENKYNKNKVKLTTLFFGATAIFILVYLSILKTTYYQDNISKPEFKIVPVTSEKGQEWSPSISSNGKYLAYSHRLNAHTNWEIKIKNLFTDETQSITKSKSDFFSPVWAPNSNTLYFIKNTNGLCEIWQLSNVFSTMKMKQLGTCGNVASMSPLAIDKTGEWLYFSSLGLQSKFSISRLNTINDTVEILSVAPATGLGDYTLAISPDNKYIAFLRASTLINSKLMLLNIKTRELQLIREINHNVFKISWNNNNEIVYINNKNTLIAYNIVTKKSRLMAEFQNKTLAPLIDNENIFIIDGNFFDSDIYSVKISSDLSSLSETIEVSSSFQDYSPAIGEKNDIIAFTSDRSGIPQIWIKDDRKIKKLTNYIDFSYITEKHFSFDNKLLLFLRDSKPFIFDLEKNTSTKSLTKFKYSISPIWSCDNKSIYISSKNNGSWNLYKIDKKTLSIIKKLSHVTGIKSDCNNSKYYVSLEKKNGLFELSHDMKSTKEVFSDYHLEDFKSFQIDNNYLYILDDGFLRITNLETNITLAHKIPYSSMNGFRINGDTIFYSRRFFKETSIKLVIMSSN